MQHQGIEQLLGSTLILVAHPDDESIGCSILLQRMSRPIIVLCTDGAPNVRESTRSGLLNGLKRAWLASRRSKEVRAALRIIGIQKFTIIRGIRDQELHNNFERAFLIISDQIAKHKPDAILTHAFEAGHPDHDSCAFLAYWAGQKFGLPTWEMPLYFRPEPAKPMIYQRFYHSKGNELTLSASVEELRIKHAMLSQHKSQQVVLAHFDYTKEVFRPQETYDFSKNPNPNLSVFAVCSRLRISDYLNHLRAFRESLAKKIN